jgi:hypothetical protein
MTQTVIRVEDVTSTKKKLELACSLRDHLESSVKGFLRENKYMGARVSLSNLIASLEADVTIEELMGG